ncbi:MAG: hypothetical protein IPI60_01035 [Saprospiraceae bacterium]|nr:hypothetical protein [Saprospiraceae bacterium]
MAPNPTRKSVCIFIFFYLSMTIQSYSANAQAKENPLSFDASMGASILKGPIRDSGFPFGLARNGYFVRIGAHYLLMKNAGISLNFSNSLHPYDINAAASYLLEQDPFAFSLMVRSGDYSISILTSGIFYNVQLAPKWSVQLTGNAGIAIVQTPRIRADLLTEPNTSLRYEIGRASAFAWSLGLQPRFQMNDRMSFQLSFDWSASNPVISGFDQQRRAFSYGIGFQQMQIGAGIVFHIQKQERL